MAINVDAAFSRGDVMRRLADVEARRAVLVDLADELAACEATVVDRARELTRPRVCLASRRGEVRVVNVPGRAGAAPRLLTHRWSDPVCGQRVEPVARLVRWEGRDAVFRLARTRAAGELVGLLSDGVEPSVTLAGSGALVTVWE